ncbi:hypothetical protein HanIR_Chr11g0559701 [Helianthus annuus]|nr:hypothetical protein HanIR_Chr11g0559701 [Helianthus annuus]
MVIPTDFVILDDTPLVLGRPFVKTHEALKNRKFNNLPLQLGAFKRSIDLERSMKYPFGNNDPLIENEPEPPDKEGLAKDPYKRRTTEAFRGTILSFRLV